jgi:three-Cys-motif partner protein
MAGKNKKLQDAKSADKAAAQSYQLRFSDVEKWEIPPAVGNAVAIDSLPSPIWTETKAQLIANYLRLFLMITKHGVYIDGFAGPQDRPNPDSWAAKLVVEMSPPWMKAFFLCELNKNSYAHLIDMLQGQPTIRARKIQAKHADFNEWVNEVLASGLITEKTASFALLDQRSTECHWATVKKLAEHKRSGNKIELFYFFPTGWIHRTVKATENKAELVAWWGDDSWKQVETVGQDQAQQLFLRKIQALGYKDVKSWPISSRELGAGRTMYHMIHATDHLEAPKLMFRAYRNLIGNVPAGEQSQFPFEGQEKIKFCGED